MRSVVLPVFILGCGVAVLVQSSLHPAKYWFGFVAIGAVVLLNVVRWVRTR